MDFIRNMWVQLLLFFGGMFLSTSLGFVAYIPFVIVLVLAQLYPSTFSAKSETEIKAEWVEKAKAFIRTLIQIVGVLIVLGGFGINIPYIDTIKDMLTYLGDNLNVAADALNIVIGIVVTVIGFFKDKERFEVRANPHEAYKIKDEKIHN